MALIKRHYIRAWRQFRGLTQEQLADRMCVARSYVTHIENGKRRYDQPVLEAAAKALDSTPADLIGRNPSEPTSIWSIWEQIPETELGIARRMLEALTQRKTH